MSKLAKVQPHIPLIRFRKGSISTSTLNETTVLNTNEVCQSQPSPYEWWEKPEKYAKPRLDDKEIDLINSGGADAIFQ